jgi:hypothetical protein
MECGHVNRLGTSAWKVPCLSRRLYFAWPCRQFARRRSVAMLHRVRVRVRVVQWRWRKCERHTAGWDPRPRMRVLKLRCYDCQGHRIRASERGRVGENIGGDIMRVTEYLSICRHLAAGWCFEDALRLL